MRNTLPILILATVLLITSAAVAADRVVVIPLNTSGNSDKLWGEGRPEVALMTMKPASGYCQMPSGIKYAISTHLSDWNSTASVCPAKTWVCSENDIKGQTPCSPPNGAKTVSLSCSGVAETKPDPTWLTGWLSNAGTATANGKSMVTDSINGVAGDDTICTSYFAWCCWN